MFRPNLVGEIQSVEGRDVHGLPRLGKKRRCPFGSVSFKVGAQKTTVRADSSASRGSADEMVIPRGRILIPIFIKVNIGDIFTFEGETFKIASNHKRYAISGKPDHFECDLEFFQT